LSRSKKLVFGSVLAAIMLATGVAFAAWSVSGSGNASTKAGHAVELTTSNATPTGTLYPGVTSNATITVNNTNPFPVIFSIAGNGAITSDKGAACDLVTGVSFTGSSGHTLGANGSATITLTNAVTMSNASDTTCQDAVFTIPVALSGSSNAA
jgi:hypothetical protein